MTPLQIASVVLVLAAVSGSFNYFVLKLPASIGIMVTALLGSIIILGVDRFRPGLHLVKQVRGLVASMAFADSLLDGMLGLLRSQARFMCRWTISNARRCLSCSWRPWVLRSRSPWWGRGLPGLPGCRF